MRETIRKKLRDTFDGKIVRKDLTKQIKEGANVPVYVLEFLLGQYCSSDDTAIIEEGVQKVKRILADNFVRPDEAQKILSVLRKNGSHTVIDMVTVELSIRDDRFYASFSNLGLHGIPIADEYPEKHDRLLCGGIWCIVQLEYEYIEEEKNDCPIHIRKLSPIQMPHVDIDELKRGRSNFTKDEWIDVLLRSIGMEPDTLSYREKWLLITRMLPLVENNFNLCELGPRSTGKSHLYKEISPNSILVSGGQTTVANLFYNMGRKTVGLVGLWDCVAFDEVAGIKFKDKDGIQIMKDYMASGSFARGKEEKAASASMVFVGNINQSVDVLLKTSSLFDPFPPEMGTDTAFLDRIHCYLPGWEVPKFRPEHFTNDYGFITDYLSEFIRELRKEQYGDALDRYFRLGKNLNQRDTIAVRKMIDGYLKLIYPNGDFTKEDLEEIVKISLEMRRRVKEQLKKLGGMEFYDVNFSYINDVDILINNAGTQNEDDIDINLKALIYITEKYGVQANIKSILNIGSASAHTGSEFPEYCASKGGVLSYTKNVAIRIAKYGATCNSLDPGGVITPLNDCVMNDPKLWAEILKETPLKRWASVEEIAEWAYFLTVKNKFCTGQNILVDGGESINFNFVWKD